MDIYDTIIIGGGPAGLSAAVYACRAGMKAAVAEKDRMGAGQMTVSEQIDNYLGFWKINGFDLGQKFREHAFEAGAEFVVGEVCSITPDATGWKVTFKDGLVMNTKTIVYAAGTSYRRLEVPGAELLGVSYCAVCDGMFYKNKRTAVVGGGDTALGDALHLAKIAEKVFLIHRRNEFRANKTLQEKVRNSPNIELVLEAVPTAVLGEKRVSGIEIMQSGEKKIIDVSGIFTAIGSIPNSGLLKGIADLDKSGYVIAGEDGVTSAAGIFAAGDVRTKSMRQIVTAAADGACCINSAETFLNQI